VVTSGPPEEVARSNESRTAGYLARFLEQPDVASRESDSGVLIGSD